MHIIRKLLFAFLACTSLFAKAQYYPTDYFQSPMDTPLLLSAPFGSLRDNHFHTGMDIRTYEREGLPVYAAADGYVSRIKISPVGYGKALYIDHPNGYTTVYGHLRGYETTIGTYIKNYQYETKSFDFDHFPGRDRLPVKKGQIIGWSGNSGGSTGPHLHFEIRHTKSEEPVNPQLFGILGTDSFPPAIRKVLIYNLDGNRPLSINDITVSKATSVKIDSIIYYGDTVSVGKGTTGFAIEAYDYMTNPTHEYSLYGVEMFIDARKFFSYRLDRVDFENSRCINAHIDYELYKQEQVRFQKCFIDDGNNSHIYNYLRNKGKFRLKDDSVHEVRMTVYDFNRRGSTLVFHIRGFNDESLARPRKAACATPTTLYPKKDNVFRASGITLEVPARALYDTLEFCYELKDPEPKNALSATHRIHDYFTPLHRSFSLSIRPDNAPAESLQDKLLLAYYTKESKNISSAGGTYKNGMVTARSTSFGNYFVSMDTVVPIIKPVNISKDGMVKDTFALYIRIDDNLSGIASYTAAINGKWVLMEYDAKNDLLIYEFDQKTIFGEKIDFNLTVTDKKNNVNTFRRDIVIAPR